MFLLIWPTLLFSVTCSHAQEDQIQKPTVMVPPLTEGQQATLTCSSGLFDGSEPKITWMWRRAGNNRTEILTNVTQRQSSKLMFNVSAEHHGTEVTCKVVFTNNITNNITTEETVTLSVTYMKPIKMTGNTRLKEGETLNLTCSVDSFPPSLITWTKLFNKTLTNGTASASLVSPNVTAEYSGQYVCTAKHLNGTLTERVNITVMFFPMILKSSGCKAQAEVLTCVCISEGFPLPTITWPLLRNHTEYSITTDVSNHTINISLTVSVKDHNYSTVECVSSDGFREAKENLTIIIRKIKPKDLLLKFLKTFKMPQVIIAFCIGIFLSATVCCLVRKCHRNKQKSSVNMVEALEMSTTEAAPLMAAGTAEGGAEAREVEYSDINFSLLKRSAAEPENPPQTKETEYAEIKNKKTEERQDNCGEHGDMLDGNEEEVEEVVEEVEEVVVEEAVEVEVMMEESKETKQCIAAEEEGGEDVAVYSNVNEIMCEL